MTEPNQPATAAGHAAHDPTWMAALVDRDPHLSPIERTRAQAALESCGSCADLFADLVALSAAIPSAAIPARPRDFTLTVADAARLRPRGVRRLLKAIGSARDGVTFPLALGMTTMGIAGLLVATVPTFYAGAGGATSMTLSPVGQAIPQPASAPAAPAAAPAAASAPAASGAVGEGDAAAASAPAAEVTGVDGMTATPTSETTGGGEVFSGDDGDARLEAQRQDTGSMSEDASIRDDVTGLPTLVVVAATSLLAGLGLFALRWSARRLGDG